MYAEHSSITSGNPFSKITIIGHLYRDDSKYGYDSDGQNFYLKIHHEFQKMVLISFKDLYKIHIFPKFHRCGSKIVPAMPF